MENGNNIKNFLFELSDKILKEASERSIILRLMGGIAVWTHCPKYKYLLEQNRHFLDIDFAAYLIDVVKIQKLFIDMGFEENKNVMRLFGNQRRIFYLISGNVYVYIDIVLDKIHFCHDINLKGRLEIDYPTLALSDLLLSKLQIVQLNEKDVLDSIVLLLEHDVNQGDNETINIDYVSKLCSINWGLWKTIIENLNKIDKELYKYLTDQKLINELKQTILKLKNNINIEKKSLSWKMRNLIGDRIKWYRDVDELQQATSQILK